MQDRLKAQSPHDRAATSPDAAGNLLLAATRQFCETERPTREAIDQYREAFYLGVPRLPTATRQSVATLLSRTPYCPRPVALFLAMDVPAVAHSILRHSTVLGERDLEQIMARTTPVHVRLLAARSYLPEALVEQIATMDDPDIRAALFANPTLELDDATKATLDPGRMPAPSKAVRSPAPTRHRSETVERASPTGEVEARLRTALANTSPRAASRPSMDASQFKTTFEAAAMKRDRKGMIAAMRDRFALRHKTAVQALDDRTGDALQVMMKAEGFDAATASRVVMLAIPAVGLSPAATERAIAVYDRLQPETCLKAFAQWPRESTRPRHVPAQADADGVRRDASIATGRRIEGNLRRTG